MAKTASEIMTRDVVTVGPDAEVVEVARILMERRFNALPVVDGERIVGLVSESDLVEREKKLHIPTVFAVLEAVIALNRDRFEHEMEHRAAHRAADIMTAPVIAVGPDATLEEIATLMSERRVHTLPVVEDDRLVGIIGRIDVLRAVYS